HHACVSSPCHHPAPLRPADPLPLKALDLARDLHPSPTRRSSALRSTGLSNSTAQFAVRPFRSATLMNTCACGFINDADRNGRTADRKSTRLNSSHLGISYAVFCLKKKK